MSTQSANYAFSPDFAARVMAKADGIRRRRRVISIGAVAAFAGSAVTAFALLTAPAPQATRASQIQAAAAPEQRLEFPGRVRTDPLQFLFPDAEAVTQFAETYSDMAYGPQRRPGELLVADEAKDDAKEANAF